ncbi:DinB family protein, partial [Acidobacteria bacterium AH-259-L09]|nr:DinB family protein [Acidobacteria bacterium AH-259-L09]
MTSTEQLIEALGRAPSIIVPLIQQADPTILKRRPPSGKWSIHEHACHLAEVHPLFFQRLDLMLSEDNPIIRSYDPGRDDPQDALLQINLNHALHRFKQDRDRLVEKLRQLEPEDWNRTAQHEEYNSYSVFTMFQHWALHDFFHAYR